ncbi:MAG: 2-oxoacid:ferredoxin oxidoreductase subunit beta [bacterium]
MTTLTEQPKPQFSPNDFASDRDVRWCPGCGDYAILSTTKRVLASLGVPRERYVFVSGIGCSSRFPYYVETYGIHGIHGRAAAIASGVKIARPDMQVWVMTGDGDGISIGGNHLIHTIRRNVDLKIVLFNNRIYGLTKGQYSPTSERGKVTVSSPYGTVEHPMGPISLALGAEATFVARTIDMNVKHLALVLEQAAKHKGTAFVEVYQNCNIFNDGAYDYATNKDTKSDTTLVLEHGKPLIFGKDRDKGIRLNAQFGPEVVKLGENGITEKDLLVHNEKAEDPSLAFMLSRLAHPDFPEPIGVFRAVERPTFDGLVEDQIEQAIEKRGEGVLQKLLTGNETWTVD